MQPGTIFSGRGEVKYFRTRDAKKSGEVWEVQRGLKHNDLVALQYVGG